MQVLWYLKFWCHFIDNILVTHPVHVLAYLLICVTFLFKF
jgi:hypothetical protein